MQKKSEREKEHQVKSYKITKDDLSGWDSIYEILENDSVLVKTLLVDAKNRKNIKPNDLDNMLLDIKKHVRTHIEITSSGIRYY